MQKIKHQCVPGWIVVIWKIPSITSILQLLRSAYLVELAVKLVEFALSLTFLELTLDKILFVFKVSL